MVRKTGRVSEYEVLDLLIERHWSRAIAEGAVSHEELMSLFEAAKWAPSSFNEQPWRFIYALHGTPRWEEFFNLLMPANQAWAKTAPVLVIVLSSTIYQKNKKFAPTHSYDTGAACQNMALQGFSMGIIVHAIGGFYADAAAKLLNLTPEFAVEVMFAIGRPGDPQKLPAEWQAREEISQRKKLSEIVFHDAMAV